MRKINVTINDDKTVELGQEVVGYVEENKATQLVISLNAELQGEEISYHVVSFRHGENDEKMVSQRIYERKEYEDESEAYRQGNQIYIMLPQYVTKYPVVYVQVEGHVIGYDVDTEENYLDAIIKSPVFSMKLDESIVGEGGEFNTKVEGIFADMQKLGSSLEQLRPLIPIMYNGIEWEDIQGITKPPISVGEGENSVKIGDTENSQSLGDYSVTIGQNLTAYGKNSFLIGRNGFCSEGVLFAVANGTEETPRTLFEVVQEDASFYVKLYGITPEVNAPDHAMPTIEWVKAYLGAEICPAYDAAIAEIKNDLPEGLDQVSNEVLEVRDSLQSQIYTNKPSVSNALVLTQSGWTENSNGKYTQTVLSGINTNRRNEIDVEVDSLEEWGNCFIIAVSEKSNGIVFEANALPSKDLNFRITSTEVNYAV